MSKDEVGRNEKIIWRSVESDLCKISQLPVKNVENMKAKIVGYLDTILLGNKVLSVPSSKCGNRKNARVALDDQSNISEAYCADGRQMEVASGSASFCNEGVIVDDFQHKKIMKLDQVLQGVRSFLRRKIPFGSLPEPTKPPNKMESPEVSETKKRMELQVAASPTYAVDSFLFLEEDIDELVQEGKIKREYCQCCGSTDIGLTEFITHSFSQDQLVYLTCFLLPHLNQVGLDREHGTACRNSSALPIRTVVDVGSRLGVVLWASYFAAQCGLLPPGIEEIVGIELDPFYIQLQQEVGGRFCSRQIPLATFSRSLSSTESNRKKKKKIDEELKYLACRVVGGNCFEGIGAEEMRKADVIILHNVFEYFTDGQVGHLNAWNRLRSVVSRSGQLLVCFPSLEETFESLEAKGAFDAKEINQAFRNKNDNKRGRLNENNSRASQWISSYVERIDVSELAVQFFEYRQGSPMEQNSKKNICNEVTHAYHGLLHDQSDSCCEDEEGNDDIPELLELVQNIQVYRVK